MQGRLSPAGARPQAFPIATWRQEFATARGCGFDRIEWLVTADGLDANPLIAALDEVRECIVESGVKVTSLCADYLIERPLVRVTAAEQREGIALLDRVIAQASRIGIEVVVVPVIEGNALQSRAEGRALLDALSSSLVRAGELGVRVALESDLPAADLRSLIDTSPALGVCHDIGNAAHHGCDSAAELRTLAALVSVIHVKDRRRGGPSVPLGDGAADFGAILNALAEINYDGPLILETPRGLDSVASATGHLAFLQRQLAAGRS